VQQPAIKAAMQRPAHDWQYDTALLKNVHREILEHSSLEKLMSKDSKDFSAQVKYLNRVFTFLREFDEFDQTMEEIEMLWEDEKIPIFKSIRNAISDIKEDNEVVLPISDEKDDEGLQYAEDLLNYASRNAEEYGALIDANSPGWDRERIAKTDMVLMTLALTELIHFPYIPIKVTLNEYLELAKNYSTPQSSKFINGVLDKLVTELKVEKKLIKKGRGMIE
jgi:transcription antitermination protein NusB